MAAASIAQELEDFDIDAADASELVQVGLLVQRLRGFTSAIDVKIARRATELHQQGHGIPPEDLLARANHSSRREAERSQRRADTLGHTPEVERQLSKGHISTEHADALANAANKLDDDRKAQFLQADTELAQAAAAMSPEAFRRFAHRRADQLAADDGVERSERQRAKAALSMGIDDDTGMGFIRADLHPDDFQRVKRAIRSCAGALRRRPEHEGLRSEQLEALALVELTTSRRSIARAPQFGLGVLVDAPSLMSGRHEHTVCEYSDGTPLPLETARRLACDAEILPIVLNGDGVPIDVGRAERLATPEQRAALRSMYRTCAVGGCDRAFDDCEVHHLLEWLAGGHTDLDNLVPICSHHHHRAHEGRWRLELDADTRRLSVWLPNGTLLCRSLPDLLTERRAAPAA